MKYIVLIAYGILSCMCISHAEINWEQFLSKQDMVFKNLGKGWQEGCFTGNGSIGTMVYLDDTPNTLRMRVGRTDVYDRQKGESKKLSALFLHARLPIGDFKLTPQGNIKGTETRLDLWNAEQRTSLVTDKGRIDLRIYTASVADLIIVEMKFEGGETPQSWTWHPAASISPRARTNKSQTPPEYKENPAGETTKEGEVALYEQPFNVGGSYVTAYKSWQQDERYYVAITIQNSPDKGVAKANALKLLSALNVNSLMRLEQKHRTWWHEFYPQSFVSMPHAAMENFYWIQMYKMASATRSGKAALDLQGPWTRETPWPGYWYNLNEQLTYSFVYSSNRLELGESLIQSIDRNIDNLRSNAPEEYRADTLALGRCGGIDMVIPVKVSLKNHESIEAPEAEVGNLTWLLYYYWQHYRYSMDKELLNKLFPLLKQSVNYYLHLMVKNKDGKYEMGVKTFSPEYPGGLVFNPNYDLSICRWGLKTLLQINKENKLNDPLATQWEDLYNNMIDYPQDETGLMIGTDRPYSVSHRHYSHLMMIYPFYLLNWDQENNRELIEKSIDHWQSKRGALLGYSFVGNASMKAMMGRGSEAKQSLEKLIGSFVKPNTMYLESGPVIETPLAAVTSINELFLQYWNDTVRVLPAVPDEWKNVSFQDLRTEGAFLVSAVRQEGMAKWVKLRATVSGSTQVLLPFDGDVYFKISGKGSCEKGEQGRYLITLEAGGEITFYKNESDISIPVAPVEYTEGGVSNSFGYKK